MSEISTSRNASDIGLIVQGVLIFLSAVIGVIGYYVQGRMKSKEKKQGMYFLSFLLHNLLAKSNNMLRDFFNYRGDDETSYAHSGIKIKKNK